MTTIEKIRTAIINEYNNNASDMDWSYRAGLAKALDIINEYANQEPKIVKNGWKKIPKCTTCKYLYSQIVPCSRCKNNSEFEPQESEVKK